MLEVIRPLNRSGLPYMVTGSMAGIVYGEPRMTHDVDVVLELRIADVERLGGVFPVAEFYLPPPEIIGIEAAREQRGHFNIIHHATGCKADVYLAGRDPLHQWALERRRRVELGGEAVWMAPPEYVILRKLEFFREGGSSKHLRDVAGILRVSGELLNRPDLEEWIGRLELVHEWKQAEEENQ